MGLFRYLLSIGVVSDNTEASYTVASYDRLTCNKSIFLVLLFIHLSFAIVTKVMVCERIKCFVFLFYNCRSCAVNDREISQMKSFSLPLCVARQQDSPLSVYGKACNYISVAKTRFVT